MPPSLRASGIIACAEKLRFRFSTCENLPPAALSQRWTMPSRIVHFLLLAPKETKAPPAGSRKDVIHYGDLSSGS